MVESIIENATVAGQAQMIALKLLVKAPENVRKLLPKSGNADLEASIAAVGLLQNLVVYPETDTNGEATGKYAVTAGERRRATLLKLAKAKKLKKDEPILCRVCSREEAIELSLAENTQRQNMHPVDQFAAFVALIDGQGRSIADTAARFGVSELIVRQRIKLGRLSPNLLAVLRADEMSLEQAAALAISDDHAAQERTWFETQSWQREPHQIRSRLTTAYLPLTDGRIKLVGLDTYKAAGGGVLADLFDEHRSFATDLDLLDRLVRETLDTVAAEVSSEGWSWVEILPSHDLDRDAYRRIHPRPIGHSVEDEARLEALSAAYDDIAERGDDLTDEQEAQLAEIEAETDAINARGFRYDPEEQSRAGALVLLGYGDNPYRIERGLVRRADEPAEGAESETASKPAMAGGPKPLSATLIGELTAQRTAALWVELGRNSRIGLIAATHALALRAVYGDLLHSAPTCLNLEYSEETLRTRDKGIGDAPAFSAFEADRAMWRQRLPARGEDLWSWLIDQSDETILALLAFSIAETVDAVQGPNTGAAKVAHMNALASALDFDMGKWWTPNAGNYFARVPKDKILEAVCEGVSPQAADNLSALKKAAMADAAADRLAGTGWLPEILRTAKPAEAAQSLPVAAE